MRLVIGKERRDRAKAAAHEAFQTRQRVGLPFDSPRRDVNEVAVDEAVDAAIDQLETELA